MNITTIIDKLYMTYEHYIKQPMQAVELKLSMIVSKNPHLIYSLNRHISHPSIRKFCHVPFNN